MKFKVDENLPQEAVQLLCESGHDALSVFDQRMSGETDPTVLAVCQDEHRVLVTLDLDFANIQAYPPAATAGIVVLRLARQDKPRILQVIRKVIPAIAEYGVSRKLWIVEEDRIRIEVIERVVGRAAPLDLASGQQRL